VSPLPSRVNSKVAALAMSLLISSLPCAFAQDATTTTPPATTTTTTTTSTDSDFLKEFQPTPTTSTTTTPTTAVGPIVPVVPPVIHPVTASPAHELLKEAPKAPPAAAPAKPLVLKGRLEEIQGNGANLPVGVLLGLKAQKAKSDPTAQVKPKADQLKGLVASFPTGWQGNWGGSLSVWWTQIDPSYWQWDRENAEEMAQILKRGASGTTTFTFYQNGQQILVQPPKLTFPPRQTSSAPQPVNSDNPFAAMLSQAMTTKIPVVILGEYQGQGIGANTLNLRMLKNDIKQLKPGTLEENIIVQNQERKAATGEIKNSISETVIRFTQINANQLYVQAASIKYRNDGHFLSKEIYYGTVNRGQTTMDPTNPFGGGSFPGMGSIPGMPTSPQGGAGGMGGLDGLNNLIKQLQNGLQ
jgi:hypothetical protein